MRQAIYTRIRLRVYSLQIRPCHARVLKRRPNGAAAPTRDATRALLRPTTAVPSMPTTRPQSTQTLRHSDERREPILLCCRALALTPHPRLRSVRPRATASLATMGRSVGSSPEGGRPAPRVGWLCVARPLSPLAPRPPRSALISWRAPDGRTPSPSISVLGARPVKCPASRSRTRSAPPPAAARAPGAGPPCTQS